MIARRFLKGSIQVLSALRRISLQSKVKIMIILFQNCRLIGRILHKVRQSQCPSFRESPERVVEAKDLRHKEEDPVKLKKRDEKERSKNSIKKGFNGDNKRC
jgi:thioredoxin-related protein